MKKLQKFFAWISIFALILQVGSGLVYAQETPEEPLVEETVEEVIEETSSEETTPEEPASEGLGEEVLEEVVEGEPILTVEQEGESLPVEEEEVEKVVIEPDLDLGDSQTAEESAELNPSVSTDKEDYAPTETVTITGSSFPINSELMIKITWPDGQARDGEGNLNVSDTIITDENGAFTYSYSLRGEGQEGEYLVEVFLGATILASTTFTDSSPSSVTFCHATPPDTAANGWNSITTDGESIINQGHDGHNADIIPSFSYCPPNNSAYTSNNSSKPCKRKIAGNWKYANYLNYSGKNLITLFQGVTGQQILDNGCVSPAPPEPVCGNGQIEGDEECDGASGVPEHYRCTETCTLEYIPYCGDGTIDPGEECDDGDNLDGDGCSASCSSEECTCEPNEILACKYNDLNENGVLDGGEPGISGVTMTLERWTYVCGGGDGCFYPYCFPTCSWQWQTVEMGDTGEDGCFTFDELGPGLYRVSEDLEDLPGCMPTSETSVILALWSWCGENQEADFFNYCPLYGSIGDFVWEDINSDAIQDVGEPGIGGVTVSLYLDDGDSLFEPAGDDGAPIATQITDGLGAYLFAGLVAGWYWVDVDESTLPVGYGLTTANDPLLVELDPGENEDGADFGYVLIEEEPYLISIEKANDKTGGASAGDTVNYTLTLTNGPIPLAAVVVTDVMPSGFSYLAGSGKVDGALFEPTVSGNTLTWNLSLFADQVMVITYQAKIDGSQPAGTYYNLATCHGSTFGGESDLLGDNFALTQLIRRELTAECDVVESSVPVSVGVSTSTSIGGTVLGVATEVSTVLGAATGSETHWLVAALLMILAGVGVMLLTDKRRTLVLKKLSKISKKLSFLATLVLTLFIFAGGAWAVENLFIRVADLPEYKMADNFRLYYTALERSGNPISVVCYVKKDGGFDWRTFGGTQTEPSGSCEVFGSELEGDGTYRFKAIATSVGSVESNETFTTIDRVAPNGPGDYYKSREGSTAYKIHWKNPGETDYGWTRIFASTEQNFTADDATKKADVGGSSNQEFDYVVTGLEPDKEYYFALQGFDKAGNGSGLSGDGGSVTYEEVASEAVGEEVVVLPMEEEEGEILGEETPSGEEAAAEEGITGLISGAATQIAGMNKGLLLTGGGILLVLIGLGYYFYRQRNS